MLSCCEEVILAGPSSRLTNEISLMALSATIYVFAIELADSDRRVYPSLELRVARHPSETAEYLFTRVLA